MLHTWYPEAVGRELLARLPHAAGPDPLYGTDLDIEG